MVPCLFIEKSAGLSSGSRRLLISLDLLLPIHWKWRKLSSTTSTCWFDFSRLISICSNFLKSHSSSSKYYDQRIDRWNWKIIAFSLLSNVYSSASEGVILHGLGYSLCHHQVWVSFSRLTLIWSSPLREVFLVLHGEYCSKKYDYMKPGIPYLVISSFPSESSALLLMNIDCYHSSRVEEFCSQQSWFRFSSMIFQPIGSYGWFGDILCWQAIG